MFARFAKDESVFNRKFYLFVLAFLALCGVFWGIRVRMLIPVNFLNSVHSAALTPASISNRLITSFFPFIVTAVALYLDKPHIILPLAFLKSLSYVLFLLSARMLFGSAQWLVLHLFLSVNSFNLLCLFWYWVRYIDGFSDSAITDFAVVSVLSACMILIDCLWIMPFLLSVLYS